MQAHGEYLLMISFYRQTCKEDMFKWTVTGLIKRTETVLKQNNTMDIEEIYFDNMKRTEDTGSAQSLTVKTLAKFKVFGLISILF